MVVVGFFLSSVWAQGQENIFLYDSKGRIIVDQAAGIEEIRWNNFDKITHILRTSDSMEPDLEFHYDGLGNRITKIEKPRDEQGLSPKISWKYTHYDTDISGTAIGIYARDYGVDGSTIEEMYYLKERLLPIGYDKGPDEPLITAAYTMGPSGDMDDATWIGMQAIAFPQDRVSRRGNKRYYLENYRQDRQVVLSDRRFELNNNFQSEVYVAADYDPLGMLRPAMSYLSEEYRYGFSGKLQDPEIKGVNNSYDFGARLYDPRLGRWLSPDPHQQSYPGSSSYVGMANNPVFYIDPDGMDIVAAPDFMNSGYQYVYPYLSETNSVYQGLLKTFSGPHQFHLQFSIKNAGGERIVRDKVTIDNGYTTIEFTYIGDPFTSTLSDGTILITRSSELGKVAMLLRSGIQAQSVVNGGERNIEKDREMLFRGLKEYVEDGKHKYTDEELEMISWGPYQNSYIGEVYFKRYISERAAKKSQSYEEALKDWEDQFQDLMVDSITTIDPQGKEEVYVSPYFRGE